MAPSRLRSDKLTDYLSQLSPDVAVFLVREIERQRADGKDDKAYDAVLDAAREVVRTAELKVERLASPQRLFGEPFEDLLIDGDGAAAFRARIGRESISEVWSWLTGGKAPDDLGPVAGQLKAELRRGDHRRIGSVRDEMLARAARTIELAVEVTEDSTKARQRLIGALGGRDVFVDAQEMALAIRAAPAIRTLREVLPQHINAFGTAEIEAAIAPVERFIEAVPHRPELGFATLISRLGVPTEALRLAARRIGTNHAGQMAASSYAGIGELLLFDLHLRARRVDFLVRDKASAAAILFALSQYHSYAEGIEQELDIAARSPWGMRLAAARRTASEGLDAVVRGVPGAISRLFRPRIDRSGARTVALPDPVSVDEAERAVTLLVGCRPFLDELSLNEALALASAAVITRLNLISDQIVADLRHCAGAEKAAAREWLDAAISLTRIALSATDAELLERSGAVAAQARVAPAEPASG